MGSYIGYDRTLIYEFASRLYAQANRVVIVYAIFGAIIGIAAPAIAFGSLRLGRVDAVVLLIGAALGAIVGYFLAQRRVFALKLQAQLALCQAKIEENTSKK